MWRRGHLPIRLPREGGDPELPSAVRRLAHIWIPAFAGKAEKRAGLAGKSERQDIDALAPPIRLPREGGDPDLSSSSRWLAHVWIPAFAGKAEKRGWFSS